VYRRVGKQQTRRMKMRLLRIAALSAMICVLGLSAYAATTWTGAIDSEFGTAGNWDNGAPGSPETVATIGNGDTVSNTVDYAGASTYQLTISGGSTLNSSADFTTDRLTINDGCTLNLTDGSYSLRKTSANNNTAQIFFNGTATVNISGGVHTFRERIASYSTNSTFRIIGSAATINIHQRNAIYATIEFIFDSDGVSTFDSDSYFGFHGDWIVDATAYDGPSAEFVLFDNDHTASTGVDGDVNVTTPEGWSYEYDESGVKTPGEITLTLVEPGRTIVLFDDFHTNGLSTSGVTRDGGWAGGSADWAWSSGQLVNAAATRGAGRVVPVPAGLTTENILEFDLDYSAEGASSSLRVHLWGLIDVSSSAGTWIMNLGGTVGMWYSAGGAFQRCNLGNGDTDVTGYASAAAIQIPSNTGAGLTYSTTLSLGNLGSGLSLLSDYDYIAIGFQKGNAAATVSIDQVSLRARDGEGTLISVY